MPPLLAAFEIGFDGVLLAVVRRRHRWYRLLILDLLFDLLFKKRLCLSARFSPPP
jgi:hypothetical protein